MISAFLIGAFIASFVCWMLWDGWQFGWTAKHGLRADLFTLSRAEVLDELAYVVNERADELAKREVRPPAPASIPAIPKDQT